MRAGRPSPLGSPVRLSILSLRAREATPCQAPWSIQRAGPCAQDRLFGVVAARRAQCAPMGAQRRPASDPTPPYSARVGPLRAVGIDGACPGEHPQAEDAARASASALRKLPVRDAHTARPFPLADPPWRRPLRAHTRAPPLRAGAKRGAGDERTGSGPTVGRAGVREQAIRGRLCHRRYDLAVGHPRGRARARSDPADQGRRCNL